MSLSLSGRTGGPIGHASAWLTLGVGFFLLAWASILMSRQPGSVASLWLANGWAIAWLSTQLQAGRSGALEAALALGCVALANLLANLAAGDVLLATLVFLPANVLEVAVAAWLLSGGRAWRMLQQGPRAFMSGLWRGALLPAVVGTLLGTFAFSSTSALPWQDVGLTWFEGALIGNVVTLPLAICLLTVPRAELARLWLRPGTLALLLLCAASTLVAGAWLPMPFAYMAVPLLAAASLSPFPVLALATFLTAITVGVATALGWFVPPPISASWESLFINLPLVLTLLPVLMLGISIEDQRRQRAELQSSLQQLSRAHEGLQAFARMASHDLREPINTIASFSQLLQQDEAGRLAPRSAQFLVHVQDAAVRMRGLLDSLLDHARLDRDATEPVTLVPLDDVLNQALDQLSASVRQTGLQVQRQPLPQVLGRRSLLVLLFQNLLSRAMRASRVDEPPRVAVQVLLAPGRLIISVRDHGLALPPQALASGDLDASLALCRHAVEVHGGSMWLDADVAEGSRVCIALPQNNEFAAEATMESHP